MQTGGHGTEWRLDPGQHPQSAHEPQPTLEHDRELQEEPGPVAASQAQLGLFRCRGGELPDHQPLAVQTRQGRLARRRLQGALAALAPGIDGSILKSHEIPLFSAAQGRVLSLRESRGVEVSLLILEDDVQVARSLERALKAQGYQVEVALNASEALEIARSRPLDLILCDVRMPGVDGLEALASLRTLQEGLRSIVMTGYASEDAPIRAIQNRVDDYLLKPVPLDRLLASVRHSAELCRIEKEGRRALDELRGRYLRLISSLVSVFWEKDPWLYEHAGRVAALAVDLGVELGLSAHQLDQLELAAWLHDLGLALIERELLQQNRALTAEERALLDQHPARLRALLEDLPDLRDLSPLLVNLREESQEMRFDDGHGVHHGTMRFRAVTEPAA
ncbi:response regulator [bacterium CPR1]|nr:response regulator [bacterium CPR1]